MSENEPPFDYIDELPRLAKGDSFCFRCHPDVTCFNECCQQLDLVLSPYDVLRLRRSLRISGDALIQRFGEVSPHPGSGLPLIYLAMRPEDGVCPFVSVAGCTVYADRPGACRTYPLGRGTAMAADGKISEQYVMVREDHCLGHEEPDSHFTSESWVEDQELREYDANNDRFLVLVDRFGRTGDGMRRSLAIPAIFNLFQLDTLPARIKKERLFDKLKVDIPRRAAILADERELLSFGIEWVLALLAGRV